MNLAAWLASLAPGLVARVLGALGIGLITVTGLSVVTDSLRDQILNNIAGIPTDLINIINLAGFGAAVNMVLGALVARVSYHVISKSAKVIGVR